MNVALFRVYVHLEGLAELTPDATCVRFEENSAELVVCFAPAKFPGASQHTAVAAQKQYFYFIVVLLLPSGAESAREELHSQVQSTLCSYRHAEYGFAFVRLLLRNVLIQKIDIVTKWAACNLTWEPISIRWSF